MKPAKAPEGRVYRKSNDKQRLVRVDLLPARYERVIANIDRASEQIRDDGDTQAADDLLHIAQRMRVAH